MSTLRSVPTPISGVLLLESEVHSDKRGSFSRTYCEQEFAALNLPQHFPQHNFSMNTKRGTLRGLHYSGGNEYKLVRCAAGKIWDVAVDLRAGSSTHGKWWATELSAAAGNALFIPAGCAHGFLTLEENSHLYYLMGSSYHPDRMRGVRWDDPTLAIAWPFPPAILSEQDRKLPFITPSVA
jgi:dTDP-4-dehydrorhamnose 3,5-epimerase